MIRITDQELKEAIDLYASRVVGQEREDLLADLLELLNSGPDQLARAAVAAQFGSSLIEEMERAGRSGKPLS